MDHARGLCRIRFDAVVILPKPELFAKPELYISLLKQELLPHIQQAQTVYLVLENLSSINSKLCQTHAAHLSCIVDQSPHRAQTYWTYETAMVD